MEKMRIYESPGVGQIPAELIQAEIQNSVSLFGIRKN
jgi:hypothetical protein